MRTDIATEGSPYGRTNITEAGHTPTHREAPRTSAQPHGVCTISSTTNGRQTMRTLSGQGFTFSMEMMPIKDGSVAVKRPGMHYKFSSYPTGSVPARFTGLGEGKIAEMKAEVEVDVRRFQQP